MSTEENKAVVRRFVEEVQSHHKLELVDQLFDPSYNDHASFQGSVPGIEGFKQLFGMMLGAFPDLHAIIHDQIAEGDSRLGRLCDALETGEFKSRELAPRIQSLFQKKEELQQAKAEAEEAVHYNAVDMANPQVVQDYVDDLRGLLERSSIIE